jgi:GDP-L-fucose synthase
MKKNDRILVLGSTGLVGSAILSRLKQMKYKNLLYPNRKQLDLFNYTKTLNFIKKKKPKYVFLAAAHVGGVKANNEKRAEFISKNLLIQHTVIHTSYLSGVKNLLFIGSSCVYPNSIKRPISEKDLLSGYLEQTNEPFAVSKIAGIKMCESYSRQYKLKYFTLMPCNIYGPGDHYNLTTSHFLPAMLKKIHLLKNNTSKTLHLWGNGKPKREVLFSRDFADACIYFMRKKHNYHLINVGSNEEYSIHQFAKKILNMFNLKNKIRYNNKLNGTFRKKLDLRLSKKLGWEAKIQLEEGLKITYQQDYKKINEV